MQKVAAGLETAVLALLGGAATGAVGGVGNRLIGRTDDNVGYIDALKEGARSGATEAGLPAAALVGLGRAIGSPGLMLGAPLAAFPLGLIAGVEGTTKAKPESTDAPLQKQAFTLAELATVSPVIAAQMGGASGLMTRASGLADDDAGYLESLKRGVVGGATYAGIPAALLAAAGWAARKNENLAVPLWAGSAFTGLLGGTIAGAQSAAKSPAEKAANFAIKGLPMTVELAKALRAAGGSAALGAHRQTIDTAAREAEKRLLARSSLFGTQKPNLEIVPGIEQKLDLISRT